MKKTAVENNDDHGYKKVALDNVIFLGRVGSHLYGTSTPESDEDYTGVFMPNDEMLYGLYPCQQVSLRTNSSGSGHKNTADDEDIVYYTLKRFYELAMKNNPNIVELFFLNKENIKKTHWAWEETAKHARWFISRKVFDTFMGYATAQEHLMKTKTERYLAILGIKKFMEEESLTEDTGQFNKEQLLKLKEIAKNYRNTKNQERDYEGACPARVYRNICEEINRYGYRRENILKYGFEVKFGSNLVRILAEGKELACTGRIKFPLEMASTIKDIKEGKMTLNETLKVVDELKDEFRSLEIMPPSNLGLREKPDAKKINKLLIDITKKYIQEA